ncbi:MAG: hypothetical protein HRS50_02520 [Mycoplasmataceae bacterium]|nr:hypothetical protein [Mycoplasmataceae bacterium]
MNSTNEEKGKITKTNISGLKNYQKIEGKISMETSELKSNKLIFQNKVGESIIIKDSLFEGDASIFGNVNIEKGKISGNAVIFGDSKIKGDEGDESKKLKIAGYSKVFGKTKISGSPEISGFVNIYGESEVHDNSKIYGSVNILDDARVSGNAKLHNREIVNKYEERFE